MTSAAPIPEIPSHASALRIELEAAIGEMLAPELRGREFRIILASELPAEMVDQSWLGAFSPVLWHALGGRRPSHAKHVVAIALNDLNAAEAPIASYAAHESAHAAQFCNLPIEEIEPRRLEFQAAIIRRELACPAVAYEKKIDAGDCEPWYSHGPEFIRAAMHIAHRLRRRGFYVPISCVFDGPQYELSHSETYWETIRDEADDLAGAPIAGALAQAPPAEFLSLFERDVSRFRHTQPQKAG